MFLVAPQTVKNCDNIVMMDEGKLVEEGTHEQLLALPVKKDASGKVYRGFYHNQWDTQMGEESFGAVRWSRCCRGQTFSYTYTYPY